MQRHMKKTEFIKSIAETLMEWYPAGGYRITMDDLKKNVPPKAVAENDAFNDAGEPLMTAQQYRDYGEPSEPDPDEKRYNQPSDQSQISEFTSIDWKELFETLKANTDITDAIVTMDNPKERNKLLSKMTTVSDLTEENPEERGFMRQADFGLLEDAGIVYSERNDMWIDEPKYLDYNTFIAKAKEVWTAAKNGTYKQQSSGGGGSNSESAYMRGYEPMSEQKLRDIYQQFKQIIKEEINEVDFTKKIRGVVYEYAQETPGSTPTTQDPARNPEENPDNIINKGQNMEDVGKAMKDMGEKVKGIKSKAQAVPTPASTGAVALKEYVKTSILPAVVEIINKSQNPRATKRELMEMFNLTKKIKK